MKLQHIILSLTDFAILPSILATAASDTDETQVNLGAAGLMRMSDDMHRTELY